MFKSTLLSFMLPLLLQATTSSFEADGLGVMLPPREEGGGPGGHGSRAWATPCRPGSRSG